MPSDRIVQRDAAISALACGFCGEQVSAGSNHSCPGKEEAENAQRELFQEEPNEISNKGTQ